MKVYPCVYPVSCARKVSPVPHLSTRKLKKHMSGWDNAIRPGRHMHQDLSERYYLGHHSELSRKRAKIGALCFRSNRAGCFDRATVSVKPILRPIAAAVCRLEKRRDTTGYLIYDSTFELLDATLHNGREWSGWHLSIYM